MSPADCTRIWPPLVRTALVAFMLTRPPACNSAVLPAPPLLSVMPAAIFRLPAAITEALPVAVCTLALRLTLPDAVLTSTLPLPPALIRLSTVSAPPPVSAIEPLLAVLRPVIVPVSLTVVSAPRLETRLTLLVAMLPTLRVLLSLRNTPALAALARAATVTAAISRLAAPVPTPATASRRTLLALMLTIRLALSSACASVMAAALTKLALAVPASMRPTAMTPPALSKILPFKVPMCAAACMVIAPSASTSTVLPVAVVCTLDELVLKSTSPRPSKLMLPCADDTAAATSRLRAVAVLPLAMNMLPLAPVLATAPLISSKPSIVARLRSPLPAATPPSVMPAAPTSRPVLSITDMPPLVVLPPLKAPTVV